MKQLKIGILDNGFISEGSNAISYIQNLMDEALLLDDLKFSRIWVTEHHGERNAWHNPEVLVTLLAGTTKKIRIGVAGVLLPIHSPLYVAQCYKLLNNLFDDRIDLGIAKSLPGPDLMHYFTNPESGGPLNSGHYDRINDILDLYKKNSKVITAPHGGTPPKIWILGSSPNSTAFSIKNNVSLCFSLCHTSGGKVDGTEIAKYKEEFFKTNEYYPKINLCLSLMSSESKTKLESMQKRLVNVEGIQPEVNLKGDFCFVRDKLIEFRERYHVDEFTIVNFIDKKRDKFLFYEKISQLIN
ncbi:MAG: LLM class flavin-dependent oxidoreductase [Bacteroidia bacterium]